MPRVTGAAPLGLTVKQAKFVRKLMETGSSTDAAEAVYNVKDRKNANWIGKQNLTKPNVKAALIKAFEKRGLTPDYVADKLVTNIDAGTGVKATASDANRAIDVWAKLMGMYDKEEMEQSYKVTLSRVDNKELVTELERRIKISSSILLERTNNLKSTSVSDNNSSTIIEQSS